MCCRNNPCGPLSRVNGVDRGDDHLHAAAWHVDREYGPAFVFDIMEPERPKVDRTILEFVKSETFDPADFTIRTDGAVRLNPQLARHVAALAANDRR